MITSTGIPGRQTRSGRLDGCGSIGGPQFQVTQQVLSRFAEAIQTSGVDVVPRVVVSGGNNAEGGSSASSNVMEGLLTMLLSERFGVMADESAKAPRSPEADALREQIRKDMEKKK